MRDLTNAQTPADVTINSPIPGQSPSSEFKKPLESIMSYNSALPSYLEDSEAMDMEPIPKVTDSMDKIFSTQERSARHNKKKLMIGDKKITSDVSSSDSRERELAKRNKVPLLLKAKDNKERNSARKITSNNINKELAKKYAGKIDIGKVNFNLFMIYRDE
jgi:hypothetical protein